MSQENVEIVLAVAASVADGEATAWFRAMDPEVRVYPRPDEPGVQAVYEGWDGFLEYSINWFSQWDEYELEPVRGIDAGDQVLVVMLERGRLERDGLEVVQEFSHSFKLRDERIVEWRMYDSHAQALEAVGLPE